MAARGAPGRISARLLAGAVLLAIGLGSGVGFAAHALLERHAAALPATVDMRHGLYGDATWAAGAAPAPPITSLHDQTASRFALSSLRGHTVALAFFDSYCHQE
ncbi:MAG: hypothetical protein ACRDNJ_09725, partial [Solirubrobacteraceae bacterium]